MAGESGADVYDRVTIFEDHLVRDIDSGRFGEEVNLVLITHGLTLRVFLSRWFHWTVEEFDVRPLLTLTRSQFRCVRFTTLVVPMQEDHLVCI